MKNTGLDELQIIIEAKNHWLLIKQTTRFDPDSFYESWARLRGYTANDALSWVKTECYPGYPFWATVNQEELIQKLIIEIEADHEPGYYEEQMRIRDNLAVEII
jgi:hypothetical protein